jgi:TatD DNase family protein
MELTDTHCHLYFEAFDSDRQQVIERARAAGLVRILNPGIDLETSRAAIQLTENYPEVYAAVGIHPNSASAWNLRSLIELRSLANHPKVVAIGEIGLDYYRDRTPVGLQKEVFRDQLALAAELGLPVVLHNRQASDDMLDILSDWHAQLQKSGSQLVDRPGVMHSFSSNLDTARKALAIGFRIGITGPVTFRNAADLQTVVKSLPTDRLLIETDSPFLAPHPLRGKRNEPACVANIAEKIAELHGLLLPTVASVTTASADRLFHWRESS